MFSSIFFVAIISYQGKLIRSGTMRKSVQYPNNSNKLFHQLCCSLFVWPDRRKTPELLVKLKFCYESIDNDVILRMIHYLMYIRANIEIWLHKRKCYNMILESKGISINWNHSVCEEFYFLCIKYSIILRGRNNV